MQRPGEVAEDARKNMFNKKMTGCSPGRRVQPAAEDSVYLARLLVHIRGLLSQTV